MKMHKRASIGYDVNSFKRCLATPKTCRRSQKTFSVSNIWDMHHEPEDPLGMLALFAVCAKVFFELPWKHKVE